MKKFLLMSTAFVLLGGCSTIMDDQTQDITIRTPGVDQAKCIIQNQDMKFVAWNDQQIRIMKSPNDLVVHCQADSNREQTVHVKREINGWVVANVANGFVPGTAYDYFSRGAFDYPEEIVVDFTSIKPKPYPVPAYQKDKPYGMEKYGPGILKTEKNRDDKPHELKKIEREVVQKETTFQEPTQTYRPVALPDDIHRQYNPAVYNDYEEDK